MKFDINSRILKSKGQMERWRDEEEEKQWQSISLPPIIGSIPFVATGKTLVSKPGNPRSRSFSFLDRRSPDTPFEDGKENKVLF